MLVHIFSSYLFLKLSLIHQRLLSCESYFQVGNKYISLLIYFQLENKYILLPISFQIENIGLIEK